MGFGIRLPRRHGSANYTFSWGYAKTPYLRDREGCTKGLYREVPTRAAYSPSAVAALWIQFVELTRGMAGLWGFNQVDSFAETRRRVEQRTRSSEMWPK